MKKLLNQCFVQSAESKLQRDRDRAIVQQKELKEWWSTNKLRLKGSRSKDDGEDEEDNKFNDFVRDRSDDHKERYEEEEERSVEYYSSQQPQEYDHHNGDGIGAQNHHNPQTKKMRIKRIVVDNVRYTESCQYCKFRDWSIEDVAFIIKVKYQQSNNHQVTPSAYATITSSSTYDKYWCCPDCAVSKGYIKKQHFHQNTNLLRPLPDRVLESSVARKRYNWVSQYQDPNLLLDMNDELLCLYPRSTVADCCYYFSSTATGKNNQRSITAAGAGADAGADGYKYADDDDEDEDFMYGCYYNPNNNPFR